MVGATRQWVTKTIENLQKDGIISVCDRHITIHHRERLLELANG
jgi:hypothetical protein